MAFDGYFIKIKGKSSSQSDWNIPLSFMRAETYQVTMSGQDLDSYRDSDGELHRTALKKFAPKIEFNIPFTDSTRMEQFLSNLRDRYVNATEKKVKATVYIPEKNKYVTHYFYVPDITFQPYHVSGNKITYNQTRIAFISYGGEV